MIGSSTFPAQMELRKDAADSSLPFGMTKSEKVEMTKRGMSFLRYHLHHEVDMVTALVEANGIMCC